MICRADFFSETRVRNTTKMAALELMSPRSFPRRDGRRFVCTLHVVEEIDLDIHPSEGVGVLCVTKKKNSVFPGARCKVTLASCPTFSAPHERTQLTAGTFTLSTSASSERERQYLVVVDVILLRCGCYWGHAQRVQPSVHK